MAIIVPILTIQRKVKKLSFNISRPVPLVKVDPPLQDSLKITFQGKEIESLYVHSIPFANNGNVAIKKDDYVEPLTIRFEEDASILSFGIRNIYPKGAKIDAVVLENSIKLIPILLNKGDRFWLYVWSTSPRQPEVEARIVEGDLKWSSSDMDLVNPHNRFIDVLIHLVTVPLGLYLVSRALKISGPEFVVAYVIAYLIMYYTMEAVKHQLALRRYRNKK